jgi:hypothetical protein
MKYITKILIILILLVGCSVAPTYANNGPYLINKPADHNNYVLDPSIYGAMNMIPMGCIFHVYGKLLNNDDTPIKNQKIVLYVYNSTNQEFCNNIYNEPVLTQIRYTNDTGEAIFDLNTFHLDSRAYLLRIGYNTTNGEIYALPMPMGIVSLDI